MTAEHDRWGDVWQEPVVALGWAGRIAAEAERLRDLAEATGAGAAAIRHQRLPASRAPQADAERRGGRGHQLDPVGGRMTPERLAEIRRRLNGLVGPQPWTDGGPRVHCTHCEGCGGLFRTADIASHRTVCWAASAESDLKELIDEVDRLAGRERFYRASQHRYYRQVVELGEQVDHLTEALAAYEDPADDTDADGDAP